jgi:type IV secretion system protein TrbL
MRIPRHTGIAICGVILLLFALPAQAQMDPGATVSRILHVFKDNTTQWEGTLKNYALSLFWALAGLEFTWSAIKLALRNADLSEYMAELLNRVLFIGFFLTLLLHSSEWANAIIDSFRTAADSAGAGHGISPSNIFSTALEITTKLLNSSTIFNPQDAIISGLCALAILICFGLMAANMIEALIESYVVISAGVIMMGFGGSSWTSEYAKRLLIYAVSVGAKLFLLQLLMGLCERLVSQLAAEFNGANLDDALVMVGVAVIMWIVTLNVPNKLQAIINGTSFGQGGMLAGAVTAGMAAAANIGASMATGGTKAALGTAAGTASTLIGAQKLTEQQRLEPSSSPEGQPSFFRQMAKNTVQAGMGALGQRFRGEVRYGNFGGQMGHAMSQQAEALKEKAAGRKAAAETDKTQNTIRPQTEN